jgi:hypothetical protein
MDNESDKKLDELKERLDRGEYAVDPAAVAEAILRRSRDMALVRAHVRQLRRYAEEPKDDQARCSYPVNRLVASTKLTPDSPLITRPIQVMRRLRETLASAFSATFRAPGGAQTQSW